MNYDHKLVRIADLIALSQRNADFPAGLSAESAPADLVKELRETGVLSLPYVGVFSLQQGSIVFQADPSLMTALNVLNSDLPEIPLSTSEGHLNAAAAEVFSDSTQSEAAPGSSDAFESKEPAVDLTNVGSIQPERPKINLPELVAPVSAGARADTDSTTAKKSHSEKKKRSPSRRSVSAVRSERDSSSKGMLLWVAGFAMVIVAVISFWSFLRPAGPATQGESLTTQEDGTIAKDDSSLTAMSDSSMASQTDSVGTVPEQEPAPSSQVPSSTPTASSAGESLNPQNTIITSETNGYTIIVRSALSRPIAEAVLKQYESLNLPMGVLTTKEDSVTRFRTGIGVYPKAKLADLARESLGEKIPSDSWAFRIR